ncbi:pyrimidodiazepine synthase-like [Homarus americanus]|uniref:pyrimidodiazepine synthase-like n=1 Tax=Homarus americanus TaxID=6706 RepID=UPI001C4707C5|nr:pyrimidodiazepine synthase-like [Homarus americanus]
MAGKGSLGSVVTMTSKHLGKGSVCPPLAKGVLRCYTMKYCPYAQRTHLVLAAKNIKHEVVYVNLKTKPDWLFEKNPRGKVPILEYNGRLLSESLVTCDYLDEAYPNPPLYPADPWKKAQDRVFVELWSQVTRPLFRLFYSRGEGDEEFVSKECSDFKAGLGVFEKELTKRGTRFFGGDTPGMLDYMIWPWAERLPLAELIAGEAGVVSRECFPKMVTWIKEMMRDSSVKATYLPPEVHANFLTTFDPDDLRLKSYL